MMPTKTKAAMAAMMAVTTLGMGIDGVKAQDKKPVYPISSSEVIEKAKADDWVAINPENLMIMRLGPTKTVVIELAPGFAPSHIANIKTLIKAGFFNGSAVLRVQDNYVTQWGRPDDDPIKAVGIKTNLAAEYDRDRPEGFKSLPYKDAYAKKIGVADGWVVASNNKNYWLPHCYGAVAVGRDSVPDTGSGESLYTVIGHSPRHLDRNLSVVGRVIAGMEHLSALPRGTGALGFYNTVKERTAITKVELASDLSPDKAPRFERLKTEKPIYDQWLKARANRGGPFFLLPFNAVDICHAAPPIREIKP
jgi:peptidylprolyl isomerase